MWKKRCPALLLCLALSLSLFLLPASAARTTAELDKAYWPLQTTYNAAVSANDHASIVQAGEKIIQLFLKGADPTEKAQAFLAGGDTMEINILYSTMLKVARSYDALGETQKALAACRTLYPFALAYQKTLPAAQAADMDFLLTEIQGRIRALDVPVQLYAEVPADAASPAGYHGAKFEPKSGLYYGKAFTGLPGGGDNNPLQAANPKVSSGQLIYVMFETENMQDFDWIFQRALASHEMLMVAWNLGREGAGLADVLTQEAKIRQAAAYLQSLNAPVLLRFAGEMDIWQTPADPQEYRRAYRYVADIVHQTAPNVAMCWSPNHISAQGKDWDSFYPGDDCVDWVGMSLYTMKYFLGDKNQSDTTQSIYSTGKYANPLPRLKALVDAYGQRKPILLTECGVENYSKSNAEDLTAWATTQMQLLYGYAPILFPSLKAMFYFDADPAVKGKNRYCLFANESVNRLYSQLTQSAAFLPAGQKESGVSYVPLGTATITAPAATLYTYAPFLNVGQISAAYYVDNQQVARAQGFPLRAEIPLSALSVGYHTLRSEVYDGGSLLGQTSLPLLRLPDKVLLGTGPDAADSMSDWAVAQVTDALGKNLIPADLQSQYRQGITREEFCHLAIHLMERQSGLSLSELFSQKQNLPDTAGVFRDTQNPRVLGAYALGVVQGKAPGVFDPGGLITRQEAATLLCRLCAALQLSLPEGSGDFSDSADIGSWALSAVRQMNALGVMGSTQAAPAPTRFSPLLTFSREQAFLTVLRLWQAIER